MICVVKVHSQSSQSVLNSSADNQQTKTKKVNPCSSYQEFCHWDSFIFPNDVIGLWSSLRIDKLTLDLHFCRQRLMSQPVWSFELLNPWKLSKKKILGFLFLKYDNCCWQLFLNWRFMNFLKGSLFSAAFFKVLDILMGNIKVLFDIVGKYDFVDFEIVCFSFILIG